jgi:hypothetical protein
MGTRLPAVQDAVQAPERAQPVIDRLRLRASLEPLPDRQAHVLRGDRPSGLWPISVVQALSTEASSGALVRCVTCFRYRSTSWEGAAFGLRIRLAALPDLVGAPLADLAEGSVRGKALLGLRAVDGDDGRQPVLVNVDAAFDGSASLPAHSATG